MGCRFIIFHRFQKRAHFKFWTNQKAAVQSFSTDFNLLIFSWFNFKTLILQFDLLQSQINQNLKTINLFQDSDLNFQKIQPDFWFLIYSIRFTKFIKISFRFFNSWVFDLQSWFSNFDSINGFLIKILEFLISKFCFWTRFKFQIFIQKPPKRNLLLKKPISFFKMGPVNFRNPNFSFSVQSTVKNTILDRAFTRLSEFQLPDLELKFSIYGQFSILSFHFWGGTIHIFNSIECQLCLRYPITSPHRRRWQLLMPMNADALFSAVFFFLTLLCLIRNILLNFL
jgi:hypothetical protein